jgi:hypothetical protein
MFQSLWGNRWMKGFRWVSKETLERELKNRPFGINIAPPVKDWSVVKWHRERGTSHV